MIMIGAAGRNAAKTEMACRLIKKFIPDYTVIALKVTRHEGTDEVKAAGRENLKAGDFAGGEYLLVEEKGENPGKDTGRMRMAGAHAVYWLSARSENLPEGMGKFLALINNGPDKIIICESNSMRLFVKPGLFLVNQNVLDQSVKPSCLDVIGFADRVVRFDSGKFLFDIDIGDVGYKEGRLAIREDATAIILAGGKSSRMGRDKSLLPAGNLSVIEKIAAQLAGSFREILLSAGDEEKYRFLNLPVVPDLEEGQGPLMGIYSALLYSRHEINFVVACDIPELNLEYVKEMLHRAKNYDVVVPRWPDGKLEPLFAVYKKSVLSDVKKLLDAGERKIRLLFTSLSNVHYLPLADEGEWYENLNTPEDYNNYLKKTAVKVKLK